MGIAFAIICQPRPQRGVAVINSVSEKVLAGLRHKNQSGEYESLVLSEKTTLTLDK